MLPTTEIRLQNLKKLVDEVGGVTELSKILGYKQPSYLYQLLNRTIVQNGKPKNIGPNMARKIEKLTGKENGWMDALHNIVNHNINYTNYGNHNQGYQTIHRYQHQIGEIPNSANLIMPDDSMNPVIPKGSELWIDESKDIQDGKTYLIEWGGLTLIRRLYRRPNGQIRIAALNTEYDEDTAAADQIQIKGRVLKWCVHD